MIKKLPVFIFTLLLFYSFTLRSALANKIGINIGSKYEDFEKSAGVVGSGGWIVMLACPGDAEKISQLVSAHPEINLIIRGHYPGQTANQMNRNLALSWVGTLGKLPTPNKIYFMPWNEPNQVGEQDYGSEQDVVTYISYLADFLNEAGLRGSKIKLLSPMINQSHPNYSTYIGNLKKINPNFFSQFDAIAMNLYDFGEQDCGQSLCGDKYRNPAKFGELLADMGVSGKPAFGVESGTAGNNFYWRVPPSTSSPLYRFVNGFKNAGVNMFAIPTYDLAGEAGHNWSLFSPKDTANLLKSAASGGSPETASSSWNQNFLTNHNLVDCPNNITTGPSTSYCTGCGGSTGTSNEPEIIEPRQSLICQNLDIEYRKGESVTITNTPTPTQAVYSVLGASQITGTKEFSGQFRLEKMDFPDISKMLNKLSETLEINLTSEQQQKLSIDSQPLTTRVKHFITGKYPAGSPTPTPQPPIPETEVTQPGWFTSLLGVTKIICSLFDACPPAKSLTIKVNQPDLDSLSASINAGAAYCPQGYSVNGEATNLTTKNANFQTSAYYERNIETNTTQTGTTTNINEKAELLDRTRGWLVGGETLNQQYPFLHIFLTPEQIAEDSFALKNQADYVISDPYQIKNKEVVNYQNLAAVRAFCLAECTQLDTDVDISSIYNFCLSCNPDDYPLTPLDMSLCTASSDGKCNYCTTDHAYEGCGPDQDPFCEGGLCCPYQYGQASDYKSHGCEVPYANIAPDCFDPAVCHLVTFSKNPAGGFGACRYTSPEVCIRTDRLSTGSCAATCNYVCCQ